MRTEHWLMAAAALGLAAYAIWALLAYYFERENVFDVTEWDVSPYWTTDDD